MLLPAPTWLVPFESTILDIHVSRIWGHRSYVNGEISSWINSYMNTLEKAEIIVSILHIERLLKSGIPNYNSQVSDTTGRKLKRRRTKAIGKCYAFQPMQKVGLFCLFICRQLSVFLIPKFNMTYKAENWHVLSNEQYFLKHRLLDIWRCGF